MKSLITILALVFTTHSFAGVSSGSNMYSPEEIIRDIQKHHMTGKMTEELSLQVKNLMRTQKISKEAAILLLQDFAKDSMKLRF